MENEKVDPVYKYIDDKINTLGTEQKQALLKTQRHIAAFIITSTLENVSQSLHDLRTTKADSLITQLTASGGAAKATAKISDDPLSIAAGFYSKCYDEAEKVGLKTIRLS